MLSFQRSIIFCVLLAVVWVQLSQAVTPAQKKRIKNLEESLKHAKENQKLIPKGHINHFNSWNCWKSIPDEEKLSIVCNYENLLAKAEMEHDSKATGKTKDNLAEIAYNALDQYVDDELDDIKTHFEDTPATIAEIEKVVNQGQFLDYVAYFNEQSNKKLVQAQADAFKNKIDCEVARKIWAILPVYITRRSRNNPGASTSK